LKHSRDFNTCRGITATIKPIQVEIRDGSKTIKLVVAQDSERPDEYWLFRPGPNYHNDPLGEFLGRIETRTFGDESGKQ
jgi:hypothetical protein